MVAIGLPLFISGLEALGVRAFVMGGGGIIG